MQFFWDVILCYGVKSFSHFDTMLGTTCPAIQHYIPEDLHVSVTAVRTSGLAYSRLLIM